MNLSTVQSNNSENKEERDYEKTVRENKPGKDVRFKKSPEEDFRALYFLSFKQGLIFCCGQ
jgi:hypothetical protein